MKAGKEDSRFQSPTRLDGMEESRGVALDIAMTPFLVLLAVHRITKLQREDIA